jgi:hypothetical protein
MDDVPMRLCGSREEALRFIATMNADDVKAEAADVNGLRGISQIVGVGIVEFRDGGPLQYRGVRDLDGEPSEDLRNLLDE